MAVPACGCFIQEKPSHEETDDDARKRAAGYGGIGANHLDLPVAPGTNTSTLATPGTGVVDRNTGTAAAVHNRNQAVATTDENVPRPAKGANSFSGGEARRRIESRGYTTVADLEEDNDGVWRGTAMQDGAKVGVWLEYKCNIGQQ